MQSCISGTCSVSHGPKIVMDHMVIHIYMCVCAILSYYCIVVSDV